MSDKPKIKPCPNCGDSEDVQENTNSCVEFIQCKWCGMCGPYERGATGELWNAIARRADFHADLLDLYTNGDHKSGHKLSKDIRKLMLKYAPEEGG